MNQQELIPHCSECKRNLVLKMNRVDRSVFWGCPGYPRCTSTQQYEGIQDPGVPEWDERMNEWRNTSSSEESEAVTGTMLTDDEFGEAEHYRLNRVNSEDVGMVKVPSDNEF